MSGLSVSFNLAFNPAPIKGPPVLPLMTLPVIFPVWLIALGDIKKGK
jgi:hypothetical protein